MLRGALIFLLLLAAYAGYTSLLATVALIQDATLTSLQKAFRVAAVWMLPMLGSTLALRAVYEVFPDGLPSRGWLLPIKPLLYIRPRPADYSGDGSDVFQASQRQLPGQGLEHLQ